MDLCRCAEDQSVLYICPPPVTLWPSLVYMSWNENHKIKYSYKPDTVIADVL